MEFGSERLFGGQIAKVEGRMTAKRLGGLLVGLGFASLLLSFAGLRIGVLWFLDEGGPVVGYGLKVALVVIGFLVWKRAED